METLSIAGRRSSHFTRMTLVFAETLGVAYELQPVYDMTALDPESYASNPALKLPILRRGETALFGALNICRAIAETAGASPTVVWPEELTDDASRNAQEFVWHGMAAQVQLILGTMIAKLPADNVFFTKTRTGFEGALAWLDAHHGEVLLKLRPDRTLSVFEVSLFCLIDHIQWRKTLPFDRYPALSAFARSFASKPAAVRTAYAFDVPPSDRP
jgi:hypothetical protein